MEYKWKSIQTRTELDFLLKDMHKRLLTERVQRVFFLSCPIMFDNDGGVRFMSDTDLYIMFENGKCLIVDFMQPSDINIDYRELTKDEKTQFDALPDKYKDIFNTIYDTAFLGYGGKSKKISETELALRYGRIKEIAVNSFHDAFEKWACGAVGSSIIEIPAGGDYFDKLDIALDSGANICIAAADAEADFYCYVSARGENGVYKCKKRKV